MKQKLADLYSYIHKISQKGALHVMCGNFAIKFVTFFGSVFLARLLSKEQLGVLSYMENLCSYAYLLMGLGMSNAILRYVVLANERDSQKGVALFSFKRGLICDGFLVLTVLLVNTFYPYKGDFTIARELIPLLIIALPFQDIINMVQINERAYFANKRYAIVSLVTAAAIVIGRMFGAWINELKGVVIAVVVVNVLLATVLGIVSYRKYYLGSPSLPMNKDKKKEATTYGFQYMITNGLWGFFMLVDLFLLGHLSQNATVVADYKIAVSFPANMAIVSSAIGIFVASYFIKNEDNKDWVRNHYKKLLAAGIVLQLMIGVLIWAFAKPLIWLYGTQYYNVIPLMGVLIIGYYIETAFRFPTANILASIGKVKYNMVISAAGLLMQIVLDIILIPIYGAYGIAIATIIVKAFMAIALFVVFNKMYGILKI